VAMPGAGGCIPIILMCTGTATMSRTGLVFVV